MLQLFHIDLRRRSQLFSPVQSTHSTVSPLCHQAITIYFQYCLQTYILKIHTWYTLSVPKYKTFLTFEHLVWLFIFFKLFNKYVLIFNVTYFIIRDTLIITYLFYYLHKKLNKTNGHI
jgi:hypothetical protein